MYAASQGSRMRSRTVHKHQRDIKDTKSDSCFLFLLQIELDEIFFYFGGFWITITFGYIH